MLVGAPPRAQKTAYLYCQWQVRYDPIFDATTLLLCRYDVFFWDGRLVMSELMHAWQALMAKIEASGVTLATARGPIATAYLTLARINWSFLGPHRWQIDTGVVYDLLHTVPFLEDSVKRWQVQKLTAHLPI